MNYGYIEGVMGGDGDEQDAYVLGVDVPVETFTGRCIGVIEREDDVETKLVVVPDGLVLSDDEVMAAVDFQERWFRSRFARSS